MKLSTIGLALLKRSEGFVPHVSDDMGHPAIGYGHDLTQHEIVSGVFVNGITEAQASTLADRDVLVAEQAVLQLVKVPLTQGQFDALVDFTYNEGSGHLAGSTLLKLLNAGRYADAGKQLPHWDFAAGKENDGLEARREAELAIWNS